MYVAHRAGWYSKPPGWDGPGNGSGQWQSPRPGIVGVGTSAARRVTAALDR